MNAILIRTRLESDTLYLPELLPLIGKEVEISVQEAQPSGVAAGSGDWAAAAQAAQALRETGYDFDAWHEQREFDRQHANGSSP